MKLYRIHRKLLPKSKSLQNAESCASTWLSRSCSAIKHKFQKLNCGAANYNAESPSQVYVITWWVLYFYQKSNYDMIMNAKLAKWVKTRYFLENSIFRWVEINGMWENIMHISDRYLTSNLPYHSKIRTS